MSCGGLIALVSNTLEQLLGIVAVREQTGGTEHARHKGGIQ